MDALAVVAGADLRRERGGVEIAVRRAEPVEGASEAVEVAPALVLDRGVVFAALAPLAVDAMAPDQVPQGRDGEIVEPHLGPIARQGPAMAGGREGVGQVDDEARVPARGAIADPLGIDQGDLPLRQVLGEPARGRQAGETGAEDHMVEALRAGQRRGRRRQAEVPAAGIVVVRKNAGFHAHLPSRLPL